jgi:hypothetical protein
VSDYDTIQLSDVSLTETVATTTTTERYGLNGKVFNTSTSATPLSLDSVGDPNDVSCGMLI